MNKDECELANWQAIGYQHGVKGETMESFQTYQNDCAAHRVKADYSAFKQGYQQGLENFCSYEKGLQFGTQGKPYYAQCPSSEFARFNQGYQLGVKNYCSYERGVSTGELGKGYNNICPSSQYPRFSDGYNLGLNRYCSYDTGFAAGETGKAVNTNCATEIYSGYADGYAAGQQKFTDAQAIADFEKQLVGIDNQVKRQQHLVERAEAVLVSATSTAEERSIALEKIKKYQTEIGRLQYEYMQIESELMELEKLFIENYR